MAKKDLNIKELYNLMFDKMGPQGWWPADSKNEIIIGAFLTQNTNWSNVEKSLANLKKVTEFSPEKLLLIDKAELQNLIRPSGFYKNKSKALHEFFSWYEQFAFSPETVNEQFETKENLRKALLKLHGVGEETADSLLLYVFDRTTFIADAYARRLFEKLTDKNFGKYKDLYCVVDIENEFNLEEAQEFHGLIDEFGKLYLRGKGNFDESFLYGIRLKNSENFKISDVD